MQPVSISDVSLRTRGGPNEWLAGGGFARAEYDDQGSSDGCFLYHAGGRVSSAGTCFDDGDDDDDDDAVARVGESYEQLDAVDSTVSDDLTRSYCAFQRARSERVLLETQCYLESPPHPEHCADTGAGTVVARADAAVGRSDTLPLTDAGQADVGTATPSRGNASPLPSLSQAALVAAGSQRSPGLAEPVVGRRGGGGGGGSDAGSRHSGMSRRRSTVGPVHTLSAADGGGGVWEVEAAHTPSSAAHHRPGMGPGRAVGPGGPSAASPQLRRPFDAEGAHPVAAASARAAESVGAGPRQPQDAAAPAGAAAPSATDSRPHARRGPPGGGVGGAGAAASVERRRQPPSHDHVFSDAAGTAAAGSPPPQPPSPPPSPPSLRQAAAHAGRQTPVSPPRRAGPAGGMVAVVEEEGVAPPGTPSPPPLAEQAAAATPEVEEEAAAEAAGAAERRLAEMQALVEQTVASMAAAQEAQGAAIMRVAAAAEAREEEFTVLRRAHAGETAELRRAMDALRAEAAAAAAAASPWREARTLSAVREGRGDPSPQLAPQASLEARVAELEARTAAQAEENELLRNRVEQCEDLLLRLDPPQPPAPTPRSSLPPSPTPSPQRSSGGGGGGSRRGVSQESSGPRSPQAPLPAAEGRRSRERPTTPHEEAEAGRRPSHEAARRHAEGRGGGERRSRRAAAAERGKAEEEEEEEGDGDDSVLRRIYTLTRLLGDKLEHQEDALSDLRQMRFAA